MYPGLGQLYALSINNITVPTNPGAQMDIFTITAQSNIPLYILRMQISSNQSQAQTIPVNWVVRTAAGSGGATTNATASAEPPSGASATEVIAYNVTTVGAFLKFTGSDFWQLFGQAVFDRKPSGFLLTPGQTFALTTPLGGVGTSFAASVKGEYMAVK